MTTHWSSQIENEFAVRLPGDVASWFDGGLWRNKAPTRFSEPTSPEELLDRASHVVHGGAMLPDTLPILGNGFGDYLCLRFAADGKLSEVVCWWHEGVTWHPYGKTFAEAILLDLLMGVLEGADDADTPRFGRAQELVEWALGWMQGSAAMLQAIRRGFQEEPASIVDMDVGFAESHLRRFRCERYLSNELTNYCRRRGGRNVADEFGVLWPDVARFAFFDTRFLPDDLKQSLARAVGTSTDGLLRQDWHGAANEAERAVLNRSDLAWPYAVLGWRAERNDDLQSAMRWYSAGLRSMETTAEFTELWSVRDDYSGTKFVAERLLAHRSALPTDLDSDGFCAAVTDSRNRAELSNAIPTYWRSEAALAERQSRPGDAYHNFYRAGWDLYTFDDMDTILDSLRRNAQAAESECLTRIAQRHIDALL